MKKFLGKLCLFWMPFVIILGLGLFIATPKYLTRTLYYSQIDKNNLLLKTVEPRIIFIGGSGLGLGLDSKIVKDSLALNPVNTGVHGGIGLKYCLRNAVKYIQKNDIIIVAGEYNQYYADVANGHKELLNILLDVAPESKNLLDLKQGFNLINYIPEYCFEKLNPVAYFKHRNDTIMTGAYTRHSYDIYGDACTHWTLPRVTVAPITINGELNNDIFNELVLFKKIVEAKKARVFVTFPGYQKSSYQLSSNKVKAIESKLKQNGFALLGNPERYLMPDSDIFDTPYHLTYSGAKLRTQLLVSDLKRNL